MTLFALLLDRCGLSYREAADFLSMRLDSVKSCAVGRRTAPPGAIAELRALYRQIERAADEAVGDMRALIKKRGAPEEIELGIASDDHEAQSLGLPCVGAHAALLGLVAARLDVPVIIVPRGSTPATAGAADAHRK